MTRQTRFAILAAAALLAAGPATLRGQRADTTTAAAGVRRAVQRFYDAFNAHGFGNAAEFTRDDWVHINPNGGVKQGRAAVLAELREVHASFLKGVTDTPDSIAVRFATRDVAVATVPSRMTPAFTTPDGVRHVNEPHIRTFVVVRRGGVWRIMQDHNTVRSQ